MMLAIIEVLVAVPITQTNHPVLIGFADRRFDVTLT